jgi:hypothetical protein
LRSRESASEEIDGVFSDFRLAAGRDVLGCRFCAGLYGSHTVCGDAKVRRGFPGLQSPFSLALLGEAAFDPFVSGEDRARKILRIDELTIPDYPRGQSLTEEDLRALGDRFSAPPEGTGAAIPWSLLPAMPTCLTPYSTR